MSETTQPPPEKLTKSPSAECSGSTRGNEWMRERALELALILQIAPHTTTTPGIEAEDDVMDTAKKFYAFLKGGG